MKNLFRFAVVGLMLNLVGCLGPYETKLPENPADGAQVAAFQQAIAELPADEQQDIMDFIQRMRESKAAGGYGYYPMTTAREALEKQRAWLKEKAEKDEAGRKAQAEKMKEDEQKAIEAQKKRKEMLEVCTVALTEKKFIKGNKKKRSRDRISLELEFKNKGKKSLAVIQGKLEFRDKSGKLLKTIKIPFRERIKRKKSVKWSGDIPYNPAKDEALAKTPLGDLKVTWVPQMYQFTDGSRIGVGI